MVWMEMFGPFLQHYSSFALQGTSKEVPKDPHRFEPRTAPLTDEYVGNFSETLCIRISISDKTFHNRVSLTHAPLGSAISSPSPPLVFLRYLLNQCMYHHQTCSTLSPNNFTHCVKILKFRVL